jgi:hypothetical protein
MKQLSLFPRGTLKAATRTEHGGVTGMGRHKGARPFASRRPLHVVMRSPLARGPWSMLRAANRAAIDVILKRYASRYRVRVYRFANVGNHLHMVVLARDRFGFQSFLRVFAGNVARAITGARRGSPRGRFWEWTAYSRVLFWGRAFAEACAYVHKNLLEAEGISREPMVGRGAGPRARPPPPSSW